MAVSKKKPRWILQTLLALALSMAIAALVQQPVATEYIPEEKDPHITVFDGVREFTLLPAEGVPLNPYTEKDFFPVGDYLTCHGGRIGIDVSAYQKEVDWSAVVQSGIEFAFLRCGYRGYSAGAIQPDKCFQDNLKGVESAGVDWGLYFFSQALDEKEAVEEAEYVLKLLDGRVPPLPVMFDWEVVNTAGSRTIGQKDLTARADAFCAHLEAAGVPAGIYFSVQQGYHEYDMGVLDRYALWLACPKSSAPMFCYAVDYWQYSFEGTVPGISGAVDLNLGLPG